MVYFISDIHLGSRVIENPEAHQKRFISLLSRMRANATAIYILGDLFDFWYEYYWRNERHFAQFEPVLEALRETTKKCSVHFFIGNHDMWTWGWLEKKTGVRVHYTPEVLIINDKRCFLAHGDGLGSKDKKFQFLRAFFHNPIPRVLYRTLPPSWGDALGYGWAAISRRKEMANPMGYMGEHNEELLNFAKAYCANSIKGTNATHGAELSETCERVDAFIFGHRHIELAFMLPNKACVYILGDFFRQFTYAQMDDLGNITIEYDGEE